MNIGLFGGSFDPVHRGHLAVARAARDRFKLKQVHFVLADDPPHKAGRVATPFVERYAMLCLALAGEKTFVPSLMEWRESSAHAPRYSIETVRAFRQRMKAADRLFFIVGADSFLDLHKWRQPEALLHEVEFVVVSRPGYSLANIATALPHDLRPSAQALKAFRKSAAGRLSRELVLPGVTIHLLQNVHESVSATQLRRAAAAGRSVAKWAPSAVADYILKTGAYRIPAAASHRSPSARLRAIR